jgi:hypothetical protein
MLFMIEVKHALISGCISVMLLIPLAGFTQSGVGASATLGTSHLPVPVKKHIYQEFQKEFRYENGPGKPVLDAFPLKMIKRARMAKKGYAFGPRIMKIRKSAALPEIAIFGCSIPRPAIFCFPPMVSIFWCKRVSITGYSIL